MSENNIAKPVEDDVGKKVMELLIMLLEDQTGKEYEYREISNEETA